MHLIQARQGLSQTSSGAAGLRCAAAASPRKGRLEALLHVGHLWVERWSQRQHLRSLPDAALKDIGRSRADAFREYRKPFWRE
jgi:uncharacterized protein YjiS (DUF1127 family)